MSPKIFFPVLFLILLLPASCYAVPITLNDLNMVSRDVSIYQISDNGSTLIYQGATDNLTTDLSNEYSYQIVFEPSRASWLDDPMSLLEFFIYQGAGQILTFIVALLFFGAIVKLSIR